MRVYPEDREDRMKVFANDKGEIDPYIQELAKRKVAAASAEARAALGRKAPDPDDPYAPGKEFFPGSLDYISPEEKAEYIKEKQMRQIDPPISKYDAEPAIDPVGVVAGVPALFGARPIVKKGYEKLGAILKGRAEKAAAERVKSESGINTLQKLRDYADEIIKEKK